jgi:hypothetical protein
MLGLVLHLAYEVLLPSIRRWWNRPKPPKIVKKVPKIEDPEIRNKFADVVLRAQAKNAHEKRTRLFEVSHSSRNANEREDNYNPVDLPIPDRAAPSMLRTWRREKMSLAFMENGTASNEQQRGVSPQNIRVSGVPNYLDGSRGVSPQHFSGRDSPKHVSIDGKSSDIAHNYLDNGHMSASPQPVQVSDRSSLDHVKQLNGKRLSGHGNNYLDGARVSEQEPVSGRTSPQHSQGSGWANSGVFNFLDGMSTVVPNNFDGSIVESQQWAHVSRHASLDGVRATTPNHAVSDRASQEHAQMSGLAINSAPPSLSGSRAATPRHGPADGRGSSSVPPVLSSSRLTSPRHARTVRASLPEALASSLKDDQSNTDKSSDGSDNVRLPGERMSIL